MEQVKPENQSKMVTKKGQKNRKITWLMELIGIFEND